MSNAITTADSVTLLTTAIADENFEDVIKGLGQLDDEARLIIRRTLRRLTQIAVLAVGASDEQAKNLTTERNALMATLASLGEERAMHMESAIEQFVWRLLDRATDVALGKLL